MTTFHEVRFPPDISYGAVGGPGWSTSIVTTVSGHERRNANWSQARGRWNVAHGLKRREQVAELIAFFRARMGRAFGFRFKDWTDYQALAQTLGTGDGSTKTSSWSSATPAAARSSPGPSPSRSPARSRSTATACRRHPAGP